MRKTRFVRLSGLLLAVTTLFGSIPVHAEPSVVEEAFEAAEEGESAPEEAEEGSETEYPEEEPVAEDPEEYPEEVPVAEDPEEEPEVEPGMEIPVDDAEDSGEGECADGSGETYRYKNFYYTIEDGEVCIESYMGEDEELRIPTTIYEYPVTKIGRYAFSADKHIRKLIIPKTVREIRESAFAKTFELEEVVFQAGSDDLIMAEDIFARGRKLKKIVLSNRIKEIPEAFAYHCNFLEEVVWPAELTKIGRYAFCNAYPLVSSDLSQTGITSIEEGAFYGCSSLPLVKLPTETKISIGNYGFFRTSMHDAEADGDLVILPNITELGDYAFGYCSRLGSVVFADYAVPDVEAEEDIEIKTDDKYREIKLGKSIFIRCDNLKKVRFSNRFNSIPETFVSSCSSLEEAEWSDTITSIGDRAFGGDKKLQSSDLTGMKLSRIGEGAFAGCSSLPLVKLPTEDALVLADSAFAETSQAEGDTNGDLAIPSNVTQMGKFVFMRCSHLGTVTFEEGDSRILLDANILSGNPTLTSIHLSKRVNNLTPGFAAESNALYWISGGSEVTKISTDAFHTPKLRDIVFTDCSSEMMNTDWKKRSNRVVVDAMANVSLNNSYTIVKGDKLDLEPKISVFPEEAKIPELFWESDNTKAVTVDKNGVVTGIKPGQALITVKTDQDVIKAECRVTVMKEGGIEAAFKGIPGGGGATDSQPLLDETTKSLILVKGQKFVLGNKDWVSSDPKRLSVKNGKVHVKDVRGGGTILLSRYGQGIEVTLRNPSFEEKQLKLFVGQEQQMILKYATDLPVKYVSSSPDVACVDDTGNVKALGKGTAWITAYVNGVAYKYKLKVADADTSKRDLKKHLDLVPMQSIKIKASGFSPRNAKWTCSKYGMVAKEDLPKGVAYEDSVVRITSDGKLTAIGVGETQFYGKSGKVVVSLLVTVSDTTEHVMHLNLNDSKKLSIYGIKEPLDWKASEEGIISIEKNKIQGKNVGETLLTAVYEGFTYQMKVSVEDPSIEEGSKPYTKKIEMKSGDKQQIPLDRIYQEVVFLSSKNEVAYVDEKGMITARIPGSARIRAKVNGKTLTINVNVKE